MKASKQAWFSFWLGAGLLVGEAEVIGGALSLNFPIIFPVFLARPALSIVVNGVSYVALWMVTGVFIGGVVEIARRAFRVSFAAHTITAVILLLGAIGYLGYGVVSSRPGNGDFISLRTAFLRPSHPLWWVTLGGLSGLLVVGLLYPSGFFKQKNRSLRWLLAVGLAIVIFNVSDRALAPEFPRWVPAGILLAAASGSVFLLDRFKVVTRRIVFMISIVALLAIAAEAAYFGWPGKNFDDHLIFMIWDAQRPDRMGVYGYRPDTTPVLSELRDHMIRFTRAYSPANYTLPSHVSILTGRPSREHRLYDGTTADRAIYDSFDNLPETMRRRGFGPIMLTENPWLIALQKGFREAVFCPAGREVRPPFLPFYRGPFLAIQIIDHVRFIAEGVCKRTVSAIEEHLLAKWLLQSRRKGPYFLFVNWMNAHSRYYPGCPPGSVIDGQGLREFPAESYDRAVEFMDQRLGNWIGLMKEAGQWDRSLVLLTSDHGELLGEHGLVGHGKTFFEPVLRVPLLLFGPTVVEKTVGEPVPLVELKPAVEALVSPADATRHWDIESFISRMLDHRGLVVEGSYDFKGPGNSIRWFYAAWEGKYKYIQDCYTYIEDEFVPGGDYGSLLKEWRFLYDLENDPGEKYNIAGERKDIVERMAKIFSDWERRIPPVPLPAPSQEDRDSYPRGLVEQLRALGYMR